LGWVIFPRTSSISPPPPPPLPLPPPPHSLSLSLSAEPRDFAPSRRDYKSPAIKTVVPPF
jgi:hypothetical protein